MGHARNLVLVSLCFLTSCASGPAPQAAFAGDPEGRWAVRLEGTPVTIVDLRRDESAPGGWTGTFTVAKFRMTEEHSFSGVKGPALARGMNWSRSADDGKIEFTVAPDRETYTLKPLGNGTALLGWKGVPAKPLVLHRAGPNETVPDSWEPGKVYGAEDGHR